MRRLQDEHGVVHVNLYAQPTATGRVALCELKPETYRHSKRTFYDTSDAPTCILCVAWSK